jgi:hypothetical protein
VNNFHADFNVRPAIAARPSWGPLGASAILHLLLIFLLLRHARGAENTRTAPLEERNPAEAIALPPYQPPAPKPKPTPTQPQQPTPEPPPPPPDKEVILGPDAKRPAPVPKEAVPEHPPAEPPVTPPQPASTPPPPAPAPAPEPESPPVAGAHIPRVGELARAAPLSPPNADNTDEIRKALAGPPADVAAPSSAIGRRGLSKPDAAEWRPSFPDAAGQCVQIPDLGRNPDGSPVLATVIGRVLDSDGRSPLAGAYLQIVGTAFSTWTDANGEYRLEFDPHLLERCRIQYVRVVADGHQNEMLTLAIGPKVRSDDVILRRR